MANNFFLNQDPLLFQQPYNNCNFQNMDEAGKQLNETMRQYNLLQQQQKPEFNINQKDYLYELDVLTKSLGGSVLDEILKDEEYVQLNNELKEIIQDEIMSNIKWKINTNGNAVKNMERQTEIINKYNRKIEEEQRKSLNELNDYVKNYSNITFDEYKRIKGQLKNE